MDFPQLHGGAPALDFVNTINPRFGPDAVDLLGSPQTLSRWARFAGLADNIRVDRRGFQRALDVRATLDAIFRAVAEGQKPRPRDLTKLRNGYLAVLAHARLVGDSGGLHWELPAGAGVDALLLPVLASALELLQHPTRIRQCGGENCGWLFVDTTKNASRKWCSMDPCGNRDKMRRYRARKRDARASRRSIPQGAQSRVTLLAGTRG
jgi:predicted RNA-binding Zn ribbon-like protein